MPSVVVAGGGLAGLAAAAALGDSGFDVDLYEARGFLGRPRDVLSRFAIRGGFGGNRQLPARAVALLREPARFLRSSRRARPGAILAEFYFIEPGGRVSTFRRGWLPAPMHFAGSFLGLRFLSMADKLAIARGLLAIRREHNTRRDLDNISMLEWLRERRQTPGAIERFWRQVLVSAVNEELDQMAAAHGFQVFWLGFLARADSYEMGVPAVPLSDLYGAEVWRRFDRVSIHLRSPVESVEAAGIRLAGGGTRQADYYIVCLPSERVAAVAPQLGVDASWVEHSPITGIHLWFDRPVTTLPHATLLDRTIQWMYNKNAGQYLQLVVSASRGLIPMPKNEVVALALRDLAEFFPAVKEARLERSHVVKELRATFSPKPGTESLRPGTATAAVNVFLAGDWTRSGWPATMEGAVRSGYLAAEAVAKAAGKPARFLKADG